MSLLIGSDSRICPSLGGIFAGHWNNISSFSQSATHSSPSCVCRAQNGSRMLCNLYIGNINDVGECDMMNVVFLGGGDFEPHYCFKQVLNLGRGPFVLIMTLPSRWFLVCVSYVYRRKWQRYIKLWDWCENLAKTGYKLSVLPSVRVVDTVPPWIKECFVGALINCPTRS